MENTRATPCKCGHSWGAHQRGEGHPHHLESYWGCLKCECLEFETVEMWTSRMEEEATRG